MKINAKRTAPMALALAGLIGVTTLAATAWADSPIEITIKDHKFTPSEIHVQAGEPFALKIKNEDATPEEFDSHDLKVEKVIPGGSTGTIWLQPLEPGTYSFVGEYHEDTAQGSVIAE